MATTTDRRPVLDATPLYAWVGVTDLAVERVRKAVAEAQERQAKAQQAARQFDVRTVAQEVPTKAVAAALDAANKAEVQYEGFAARGKELVDRILGQQSTRDLLNQAGSSLNLSKGAFGVARKAADDTATAWRSALGVGRRSAGAVVETAVEGTEVTAEATADAARAAESTTETAAKSATARTRKNAATAKTAAKATRATAAKTATTAAQAAMDGAEKVGN